MEIECCWEYTLSGYKNNVMSFRTSCNKELESTTKDFDYIYCSYCGNKIRTIKLVKDE